MNRRDFLSGAIAGTGIGFGIVSLTSPAETAEADDEPDEFDTPAMATLADEIRDAVDYTGEALEIETTDPIVDMDEWHRSIDVRGKVGSLAFAELAHQHGAVVSAVMADPDDKNENVTRIWFRSLAELADTREINDLPEWQANQSDNSGK